MRDPSLDPLQREAAAAEFAKKASSQQVMDAIDYSQTEESLAGVPADKRAGTKKGLQDGLRAGMSETGKKVVGMSDVQTRAFAEGTLSTPVSSMHQGFADSGKATDAAWSSMSNDERLSFIENIRAQDPATLRPETRASLEHMIQQINQEDGVVGTNGIVIEDRMKVQALELRAALANEPDTPLPGQ